MQVTLHIYFSSFKIVRKDIKKTLPKRYGYGHPSPGNHSPETLKEIIQIFQFCLILLYHNKLGKKKTF